MQVIVRAFRSFFEAQAGQKQLRWPAHEGLVIAVDWNMVNDLLLSGGEDCTYRVSLVTTADECFWR